MRTGMRGVGRTVMRGTKIEPFDAEVLGVLKNTSPGRDMILCRLSGLNLIGLRRRGLTPEAIKDLKKVYAELFDPPGPMKERLPQLLKEDRDPAVKEFLTFVHESQRGICRPAAASLAPNGAGRPSSSKEDVSGDK